MNTQQRIELKRKLKEYGVSLTDVANECDCHRTHVYHVLTGRTRKDTKGVIPTGINILSKKIKEAQRFAQVLEAA
jgi:hypothetical protein